MSDFAAALQSALGTRQCVERELDRGGMSRVFLAEEVALGRSCTTKASRGARSAQPSRNLRETVDAI